MLTIKIIFIISWIIIRDWIYTHPQTQPRLIVSRTIVVHTCFLIQFLRIKEIRRIPSVVALFYEHFAERYILNMLRYFSAQVGDVTTAAQVVRVIEELHLLIIILIMEIIIYSSTCAGIRFSHRPCLCRLRRAIVAAETLTIHVVVIVLTVIRLVKRLVIVFNGL